MSASTPTNPGRFQRSTPNIKRRKAEQAFQRLNSESFREQAAQRSTPNVQWERTMREERGRNRVNGVVTHSS